MRARPAVRVLKPGRPVRRGEGREQRDPAPGRWRRPLGGRPQRPAHHACRRVTGHAWACAPRLAASRRWEQRARAQGPVPGSLPARTRSVLPGTVGAWSVDGDPRKPAAPPLSPGDRGRFQLVLGLLAAREVRLLLLTWGAAGALGREWQMEAGLRRSPEASESPWSPVPEPRLPLPTAPGAVGGAGGVSALSC